MVIKSGAAVNEWLERMKKMAVGKNVTKNERTDRNEIKTMMMVMTTRTEMSQQQQQQQTVDTKN